ncbi:MAG TPA: EAL domain-containing protein [Nocardioidaceae bacterium]|nr:EAL domain-containing protein [Nocardioidaceae bacterium]
MPPWTRVTYVAVMALLGTLYFTLPNPPRYLWTLIGVCSVAALVAGVLVNRPRHRLPWWLVTAGTATFILGDTVYDVLTGPLGMVNPFPSVADVLYLSTYPLFAGGLLLIVRVRWHNRDRQAVLDALIITTGLGFLVWIFLAAPNARDSTMSLWEKAFSIAYPLGDVLLLAVMVRLLMGRGASSWALRLMTAGTLGLLLSDVLYGLLQLNGTWETGGPVDLGWLLFYAAWGAAALEPDMARLAEPVRHRAPVMTRTRLLLLGSVSLVPPGVLLVEVATQDLHDVAVNAVASGLIFVLVTARLSGLVHVARQSTQRESVLRRTGEALVGAASREEIYTACARAISTLTRAPDGHRVLVAVGLDGALRIVHDSVPGAPLDDAVTSGAWDDLLTSYGSDLRTRHFVLTTSDRAGSALRDRLGSGVPVLLAPLLRSREIAGIVVVSGVEVERSDVIDAVCAMAAQMMLALDSADLTEQVLQRKNEAQFRSLIQNTSDLILVIDDRWRVTYQTPSVCAVLGHEPEQVLGAPVLGLVSPPDVHHASVLLRRIGSTPRREHATPADPDGEWRLLDAAGKERAFEVTSSNLLDDPSVRGVVLTLHETTERRALEQKLKHLAFHDSLTQLPNRTLFLDRVEHALARQGRHRERLAVMLIDLDDFKEVNDTRGHAAGDALLVAVSQRLQRAVRPEDTCARLGGDEFAVLVEGLMADAEAGQLAERILSSLREPYGTNDDRLEVRASIGVSTSDYGSDAAELLMQADLAMYAAKDAGKGTHEFYRPSLHHVMQTRLSKARDLQRGLDEGQFVLHYQPIVDLLTGRTTGTEALVRWQHPEKGLVLPGDFIDVVEEGDLAVPLGRWVIETAVEQASAWQRVVDGPGLRMAVNIVPRQLADPDFVPMVANALRTNGVAPGALVLEITERTLTTQEPQVMLSMEQLKNLGVGLAVDDFGTGYAALGYLRQFPVTTLKIDRSFVAGVDKSQGAHALVEAIIRLGETFQLDLVAEGIETTGQRDALIALGCLRGQGFLFTRPLPVDQATAFLVLGAGAAEAPSEISASSLHTQGVRVS